MVFLEYIPGDSFFHKMEIRPKIVWLLVIIVLDLMFNHPLFLGVLTCGVILTGAASGIPFRRTWRMLKPLLPLIFFIVFFTGFSGVQSPKLPVSSRVLFEIFGLKFTVGGLLLGVSFIFRLFIMVISLSLVTLTTPLEAFFQLLRMLRLPYGLAFALATGIRFVPTLEEEAFTVMDAQKARGVELEKKGFVERIKAQISMMVPLLVGGIRKADNLALAMLARGFGASEKRTTIYELRMKPSDYLLCVFFLSILGVGIFLRSLGYGVL